MFWMSHLDKPSKFTPDFLLTWVWDFPVGKQHLCSPGSQVGSGEGGSVEGGEGGAHKPLVFEVSSGFGRNACLWNRQLKHKSYCCIYEDRNGGAWKLCGWTPQTDGRYYRPEGSVPMEKKLQVILLIKRPLKNPTPVWRLGLRPQHFRLQPVVSLRWTQTSKICYWNQMVIRHEGSLDKPVWSSWASSIMIAQWRSYVPPRKNKLALSK